MPTAAYVDASTFAESAAIEADHACFVPSIFDFDAQPQFSLDSHGILTLWGFDVSNRWRIRAELAPQTNPC